MKFVCHNWRPLNMSVANAYCPWLTERATVATSMAIAAGGDICGELFFVCNTYLALGPSYKVLTIHLF